MFDTMSRSDRTRERILASTRTLLGQAQGTPVSMRQIAEASGVTRQLLYLHFESRAHLLLEVSRYVDTMARTPQRQARVDDAADAVTALKEAVALQGHIKPLIRDVAQAVDHLRSSDPDAADVWREREQQRLSRCRAVTRRLHDEGLLRAGWTVRTAAQLLWSVTSLRAWDELVTEEGWSTRTWVARTTELLESTLVEPPSPEKPEKARTG